MTRTLRAGALTAAAISLMLALAGCFGPTPSPTPTPTPTPDAATPRPTPAATPTVEPVDLTAVIGLVARPEGLELRGDGGTVLLTLGYMSPPADAVSALTEVFGEPPVDEPYAGTNHSPAGIVHRWDEFALDERLYDEELRQAEAIDWLVWPRFAVYFDAPAADGVVLSTASGLQAGDAWSIAEADPGFDSDVWTCTGSSVEALVVAVPDSWTGPDRANVVAQPTDDGSTVKWIGAPEMEADGCA
ncbi:hypothetical protein [Agromyces mariniharenae]|uniref:hypothetical protein n=1 Tax=Agromyces mariniharenae TaxID=2604423 RepID=UPI001CA36676|nr:hypothetical protein [Agromyces mariniharenae]